MENYNTIKKLAKGGQGTTILVQAKKGGDAMVLKQCKCATIKEANLALKEAKVLQSLNHAGIVAYYDVFLHQDDKALVICTLMEYCERGDLACYLNEVKRKDEPLQERVVLRWTYEMAIALDYLHSKKVVHRDIKPLNVFMTKNDNLKIGDFGLASNTGHDRAQSQVGTPCYLAPEVLQSDEYGTAVDIWGIGCIVLEMVTLDFLWQRKGLLSVQVLSRPVEVNNFPSEYSSSLRQLVARMLDKDPDSRPRASQVARSCQELLKGAGWGSAKGLVGGLDALAEGFGAFWSSNKNLEGGETAADEESSPAPVQRPQQNAAAEQQRVAPNNNGQATDFRRRTPAQRQLKPEVKGQVAYFTKKAKEKNGTDGAHAPRRATRARPTLAEIQRELERCGYSRFFPMFKDQELYGDILQEITDSDLLEIGVQDAIERQNLLIIIQNLLGNKKVPLIVAEPPPPEPAAKQTPSETVETSFEEPPVPQSDIEVWMMENNILRYRPVLEANGIRSLQHLQSLNDAEIDALCLSIEENNSSNPSLLNAIQAIKKKLKNRPSPARAEVDDVSPEMMEAEEKMFQQALRASLRDMGSETASSPPSNNGTLPNGVEQPRSRVKQEEGKILKLVDFLLVSNFRTGDSKRLFCVLDRNRLKLYESVASMQQGDPPLQEVVMDGLCVDTMADSEESTIFLRRSMYAISQEDLLLTVSDEANHSFVQWLQRLQASAYLSAMPAPAGPHSAVRGIVLRYLEIVNASSLFQGMSLCVNAVRSTGEFLYQISDIALDQPTQRSLMHFDLWKEVQSPSSEDAFVYFEVRYMKGKKQQPTKYWTCIACQSMRQGSRSLQVYKAPCEYDSSKHNKVLPKQKSKLDITLTA
mmetsp:Transcript_32502/g.73039  ORF Transcript_32502/g.73039 Transcript_32502/m.73039 type:complete len:867 (-) Transcript_32502:41-2641(-)